MEQTVSAAYIGRLERGEGAPGIDLVDRLASALGTTSADLLPAATTPDELNVLKEQAQCLLDMFLRADDRELLLLLNPLLRLLADRAH